jgi:hypothetical protein
MFDAALTNGVFAVSVFTVSGKSYVLEYKSSLSDSAWTSLSPVTGNGDMVRLSDPSAADPQRFYRVEVQ